MFTKQHYIFLARVLRESAVLEEAWRDEHPYVDQRLAFAAEFAQELGDDNPGFDASIFIREATK